MSNPVILIIEDESAIAAANRISLEMEGYTVYEARTLHAGKRLVEEVSPDLILLDVLLPDGNGLEFCSELRAKSDARVLFLSCLDTKPDIIAGLRAGGDDYLVKPYVMEELVLRVQVLLKRGGWKEKSQVDTFRTGDLVWHPTAHQIFFKDRQLLLKPKEYAVLEYLHRNEKGFVSEEELCRAVWGINDADKKSASLQTAVYNIRKQLDRTGYTLLHKRGKGYCLVQETNL